MVSVMDPSSPSPRGGLWVSTALERPRDAAGITQRVGSRAGMELKAPKAQVDALITKYSHISQSFTFLTKPTPFSRSI